MDLAAHLASSPETTLQALVDTACSLTCAQSAGISIAERDGVCQTFTRSGTPSASVGGTTPSPSAP